MPNPFSLRVFMPQGEPQGLRVVEKTNWTGVGLIFPRTRLDKARERPELSRTGVYVLWNDDDQTTPTIYVGQSENVSRRVKEHFENEEMDWWTKAAAFTTKDDAFNQGHARFLEWALVGRAQSANRSNLKNRLEPTRPSISEPDQADTFHYLNDLLQCLPLAGLSAFEQIETKEHEDESGHGAAELALAMPQVGIAATGRMLVDGFLVLKGSTARSDVTNAMRRPEFKGYLDLREALIEQGTLTRGRDHLQFTADYFFRSVSAATFVVGGTASPYDAWKDGRGRTLRSIEAGSSGAE